MKRILLGLIIFSLVLGYIFYILFPLTKEYLCRPKSTIVFDRKKVPLQIFIARDGVFRIPVTLKEVNPYLIKFLVFKEDKWFRVHPGINPFSIMRALWFNLINRKIVMGGSTITMQVARMMYRRPRTFKSKFIEALRALQIEISYSKDKILEIYLNMLPYGGNLEGVGTASWFYFGKSPQELSIGEAALLSVIPNSPNRLRPDRNPYLLKKYRDRFLKKLLDNKIISLDQFKEAVKEKVPTQRMPLPFIAPHIARYLHLQYPEQPFIYSTIDARLQRLVDGMLKDYLKELDKKGIKNGSVVVVKNKTGEVLALVGSRDFFDKADGGQVNGAFARRSPGSTLKPFLYALALDKGIVTPATAILDIPLRFSDYSPKNFDEKFRGIVSMEEALVNSLNMPSVFIEREIGGISFYRLLLKLGFSTLDKGFSHYGLSLILGGGEVRLIDLVNAYRTIANYGVYTPLKYLLNEDNTQHPKVVFSPGASYIISEILSKGSRTDLPLVWKYTVDKIKIAWKTGTSNGRHDAWAIGFNPEYTVGIWLGNFSGRSAREISGGSIATPLLFKIFNALPLSELSYKWFKQPEEVGIRKVCSLSGLLPTSLCPLLKDDLYIAGRTITPNCFFHRYYYIDTKTGYRLCSRCRIGREYKKTLFTVLPPLLVNWYKSLGRAVDELPPYAPWCDCGVENNPPIIEEPHENSTYYLDKSKEIVLRCTSYLTNSKVYWFLDDEFIGSVLSGKDLFYEVNNIGKHKLTCIDEQGVSKAVNIIVKKLQPL